MTVGGRAGGELRSYHAVGARPVIHDGLLTESLGELLCDEPSKDVVAAAGRERNDQAHGLGGKAARVRSLGSRSACGGPAEQGDRAEAESMEGRVHGSPRGSFAKERGV